MIYQMRTCILSEYTYMYMRFNRDGYWFATFAIKCYGFVILQNVEIHDNKCNQCMDKSNKLTVTMNIYLFVIVFI